MAKDLLTKQTIIEDRFTIATFNLFNYIAPPDAFYDFENIYSLQEWQKKQAWIKRYLSAVQPDIIGFQEVFSASSLEELVHTEGYEYFAVVDEPSLVDDYIYQDPIVAIASRFPIVDVQAIKPSTTHLIAAGISTDFIFSRQPLRATITIPHIGNCDCYVVHFKSKRATEVNFTSEPPLQVDVVAHHNALFGEWRSSMQRSSEALLLKAAITERRAQTDHPVVVMGDFNDDLYSPLLNNLLLTIPTENKTNDVSCPSLRDSYFQLTDSYHLYTATDNAPADTSRAATHYYFNKGSVLDYILLSDEFDAQCLTSLYEVANYHTEDRHLINPIFDKDSHSTDHAVVSIELKLRN
ncbi:hypothetical protein A3K86_04295 [Photobacterium jeanii]|uniref:Endonuclease/exonuclease/phosphatase domain-containing protein n=1 Tax=Photobacterium jeanii TaxID=858640 RepID=A0A178KL69_9GAMM|nr:endonuclease/exonuclease/phosphatase family protein [Photobacterium jeanii]OAN18128.1 hypothetical protein A3K86_04295 [Photobacterium jeanii]PST92196.1 endonuclease [Photobacterium jeanii]